MKTVTLAGRFGTRIPEETENRPRRVVEVGGKPILRDLVVQEYFRSFYAHDDEPHD